jgi:hypothetical protein
MKRHIISYVSAFLMAWIAINLYRAGYESYVIVFLASVVTLLTFKVF